jgi:transcriptional repressor NrdR
VNYNDNQVRNLISKSIINRLAENPPSDNFIYSSKLREYVTEELKQRNHNTIAELFIGYSKNKVTPIREELVQNSKFDSKVSPLTNTHTNNM